MAQPGTAPQVAAREVLWTYTQSSTDDEGVKEFYVALEKQIADELRNRFFQGQQIWVGREVEMRLGSYIIRARVTNVEPLLATIANASTRFTARYRERGKDEGQDTAAFISEIIRYPNKAMGAVFESLVGLDEIKHDLMRKLTLLLGPQFLQSWISTTYQQDPPGLLVQVLRDRYPLIILEGEVGSGKTALARSIGNPVSQGLSRDVVLYVLNAQVRGGGHVGELTMNISRAFNEAERAYEREQIPIIILIDEADSLAQARGGTQTHHEDDAGVNVLIQRIDRLRGRPIAVLFATNLSQSLDAAIMRRAVTTYHFDRPSPAQRQEIFSRLLAKTGISDREIQEFVSLTEPRQLPGLGSQKHRYTYSDIAQRIIPRAVEEAVYAKAPLSRGHVISACKAIMPTPEMATRSA